MREVMELVSLKQGNQGTLQYLHEALVCFPALPYLPMPGALQGPAQLAAYSFRY